MGQRDDKILSFFLIPLTPVPSVKAVSSAFFFFFNGPV